MPQSQFQQSPKASIQSKTSNSDPSTLHIIDSPSPTMAQPKKNELWGHGLLQLPTTIGMTDLNPPSKELQDQRSKAVDDQVEAVRLVREDEKERDVQEEKIKRLTAELETETEALAFMESKIKSAFAKAASTTTIDRLEQEITDQQNQPSDTQFKLEQHRQHGKIYVKLMNSKFNFKDWTSNDSQNQDTTSDNRNLGTQTAAILYVYFDLPNWFREDELCTLLGYAYRNNNVKQAIQRMVEKDMLTSNFDSAGTEKYYLSEWSSKFVPRSPGPEENPDIETTNPPYAESIEFRMKRGRTLINSRKKPKSPPQEAAITTKTVAAGVADAEADAKRKLDFQDSLQPNSNKKSKTTASKATTTTTATRDTLNDPFKANQHDKFDSEEEPTAETASNTDESSSSDSEDTDSENTSEATFQQIIPAGRKDGTNFDDIRAI